MEILRIVYAFLSIAALGGLLGLGLAYASKIFAVKKDETIVKVESFLPGLNCGTCGFAGCSSYAEAIVKDDVEPTMCPPGGPDAAKAIAAFMGKEVEVSDEKLVAHVHCRGNKENAKTQFEYAGLDDCNALYSFHKGDKVCKYGCLGKGSCIKVCPVDAIKKDSNGFIKVDKDKCISCGKCIDICPTKVMQFIPYNAEYVVACNSIDKGAFVRKACSVGCIGCKICDKKSPEGGFVIENFLAKIDYKSTGEREEALKACPGKCIVNLKKS